MRSAYRQLSSAQLATAHRLGKSLGKRHIVNHCGRLIIVLGKPLLKGNIVMGAPWIEPDGKARKLIPWDEV